MSIVPSNPTGNVPQIGLPLVGDLLGGGGGLPLVGGLLGGGGGLPLVGGLLGGLQSGRQGIPTLRNIRTMQHIRTRRHIRTHQHIRTSLPSMSLLDLLG